MPLFKDPYPDCPNETRVRVQAEIDPNDYRYLFRKVLGVRGCQEPIIGTLLKALAAEMRNPKHGITDTYDDDNFGKVQSILDRTNFNPVGHFAELIGEDDPDKCADRIIETRGKQTVARRPHNRTARSASPRDERGGAAPAHSSGEDTPNVATNIPSKTPRGKRRDRKETT